MLFYFWPFLFQALSQAVYAVFVTVVEIAFNLVTHLFAVEAEGVFALLFGLVHGNVGTAH